MMTSFFVNNNNSEDENDHNFHTEDSKMDPVMKMEVDHKLELKYYPAESGSPYENSTRDQDVFHDFEADLDQDEKEDMVLENNQWSNAKDPLEIDHFPPKTNQYREITTAVSNNCEPSSSNTKQKETTILANETPPINLTCELCQRVFHSEPDFRLHVTTHINKVPSICPVCGESFVENFLLYSHVRVHSHPKPFNCARCYRKFATNSDFLEHLDNLKFHPPSTKLKIFSCAVCALSFSTNLLLKEHTADHYTKYEMCFLIKKFLCAVCNKIWLSEAQWLRHLETHSPLPKTCSICQKSFDRYQTLHHHETVRAKSLIQAQQEDPDSFISTLTCRVPSCSLQFCKLTDLKVHEEEGHPLEDKPFACFTCKRQFSVEFNLKKHRESCVIQASQNRCPLLTDCDQQNVSFDTPADLRKHLLSHARDIKDEVALGNSKTKFGCPLCSEVSTSLGMLSMHLWIHTRGEQRKKSPVIVSMVNGFARRKRRRRKTAHRCRMCCKCFQTPCNLREHVKNKHPIHHDFKCPDCERLFLTEDARTIHVRWIHLKLPPFACPHSKCDEAFKTKSKLVKHFELTGHNKNDNGEGSKRNNPIVQKEKEKM